MILSHLPIINSIYGLADKLPSNWKFMRDSWLVEEFAERVLKMRPGVTNVASEAAVWPNKRRLSLDY